MTERPAILSAVEKLGYRATAGDVAVQSGLKIELAQQGLLALASDVGGHLQVSETGEVVYLFPNNIQAILLNKFWKLRVRQTLGKIWQVCFYLVRISFGIILFVSILLMLIAIVAIIVAAMTTQQKGDDDNDSDGGLDFLWRSNNLFNIWYFFDFSDDRRHSRSKNRQHRKKKSKGKKNKDQGQSSGSNLNFLEAIFSFLFGDGNPNADVEERRWQGIGSIIRNHDGAIVAEQLAPYLAPYANASSQDSEDYILPVLLRFNGYPEVSPEGNMVYYFPDLQVMAKAEADQEVPTYLKESLWRFSQASNGQIFIAIGLGCFNLILAVVLGILLLGGIGEDLSGYLAFIYSIYGILLLYAVGFLGIPVVRLLVIQARNIQVRSRNERREAQAHILQNPDGELIQKMKYARQFAARRVITDADITYSTEQDLVEQDVERSEQVDRDWEKRL